MAEASSDAASWPVLQDQTANMPANIKHRALNSQKPCGHRFDSSHLDSSGSNEGEDDTGHAGSTKSLSEHTVHFVYENGRRYCNDVYCMPNDENEQTRLSILHQLYLFVLDGHLTKIPLPDPTSRVLDLGAGPGDWAIAFGEENPEIEVIATDIGVFDPQSMSIAPPNVTFQIDDAEGKWTFHEPFDFIHVRDLAQAIADWPRLYRQAFEHLKPGGFIQLADGDISSISFPPDSYFNIYTSALRSAGDAAGYIPGFGHLRPSALAAAGFEDISTYDIEIPIGTWPSDPKSKTMGKMALIVLLESLEALSLRLLTRHTGWKAEDVIDLCEKVKLEVVCSKGQMGTVRVIVARKPMEAE